MLRYPNQIPDLGGPERRLVMPKRFKMSKSQSRRDFSKHGSRTHRKNLMNPGARRNPMRGGIRL